MNKNIRVSERLKNTLLELKKKGNFKTYENLILYLVEENKPNFSLLISNKEKLGLFIKAFIFYFNKVSLLNTIG